MEYPTEYIWCCNICKRVVSTGFESTLPDNWRKVTTKSTLVIIMCDKHIPKKSKDGGTKNGNTINNKR